MLFVQHPGPVCASGASKGTKCPRPRHRAGQQLCDEQNRCFEAFVSFYEGSFGGDFPPVTRKPP